MKQAGALETARLLRFVRLFSGLSCRRVLPAAPKELVHAGCGLAAPNSVTEWAEW
jgi:hypothetical protein